MTQIWCCEHFPVNEVLLVKVRAERATFRSSQKNDYQTPVPIQNKFILSFFGHCDLHNSSFHLTTWLHEVERNSNSSDLEHRLDFLLMKIFYIFQFKIFFFCLNYFPIFVSPSCIQSNSECPRSFLLSSILWPWSCSAPLWHTDTTAELNQGQSAERVV